MPTTVPLKPMLQWYAEHARPLPWRQPGATAWHILISEVMLQQTPVARVRPVYDAWLRRWPTPGLLATDTRGEAVRRWGRLGYPRRALRLHEAATVIEATYGGGVPATYEQLRQLSGIGDYTAAAVAAFAYQQRIVVLDTNVRRVLARAVSGQQLPPRRVQAPERLLAAGLLPESGVAAASWSVAIMELGATVCTARCRGAPSVRCATTAPGGKPATPRRSCSLCRRSGTPVRTGNAVAASWPPFETPTARWLWRWSKASGRTRHNANAPSVPCSLTVWSWSRRRARFRCLDLISSAEVPPRPAARRAARSCGCH